jgi:hypothetical protein
MPMMQMAILIPQEGTVNLSILTAPLLGHNLTTSASYSNGKIDTILNCQSLLVDIN